MNKDIIRGNWKIVMRKVINQWEVCDDDLEQIQGSCEEYERKFHKQRQQQKVYAKLLKC